MLITPMIAPSDRHSADAATIDDLTASGFDGAKYEAFIGQLYRYAWPVMLEKIRTGKIAAIQTKVPHPTISPDEQQVLHDSAAEREELALAAIAAAEPRFKASLQAGHWDPEAGRSLKSYFIGACAQAFWPVFRDWRAKRRRQLKVVENLKASYSIQAQDELASDPELRHSRHEAVKLLLAKAKMRSPELEAICVGLQNGMTASELADHLGCSSRAIEGRLYQLRKTAWGLVRAGRIDPALVPGSRARIAHQLAKSGR
jgi:hypothetical protein